MHPLLEDIICGVRISKRFRHEFRRAGVRRLKSRIRFSRSCGLPHDVILRKQGNDRFEIDVTSLDPTTTVRFVRERVPPCLHWFAQTPADIEEISVCVSDGDLPTDAMFGPVSSHGRMVPLPDAYFFQNRGFADMRHIALADSKPWSERAAGLRWRGTTTGSGRIDFGPSAQNDPTVLARLRFAMIARQAPDMDALFTRGDTDHSWHLPAMDHYGYAGDPIPEADWINDKFALDIDGHTNTWSNFIIRMHLGCCVLKVDSQFGYRQWYYDRIRPWEHFIPVKSDMSDLAEKLDWARSNLPEAEAIARKGQQFARSMTLESETEAAAKIITETVRAARRAAMPSG